MGETIRSIVASCASGVDGIQLEITSDGQAEDAVLKFRIHAPEGVRSVYVNAEQLVDLCAFIWREQEAHAEAYPAEDEADDDADQAVI